MTKPIDVAREKARASAEQEDARLCCNFISEWDDKRYVCRYDCQFTSSKGWICDAENVVDESCTKEDEKECPRLPRNPGV